MRRQTGRMCNVERVRKSVCLSFFARAPPSMFAWEKIHICLLGRLLATAGHRDYQRSTTSQTVLRKVDPPHSLALRQSSCPSFGGQTSSFLSRDSSPPASLCSAGLSRPRCDAYPGPCRGPPRQRERVDYQMSLSWGDTLDSCGELYIHRVVSYRHV